MSDKLMSYKGFDGTIEIDMDLKVCVGKILFIDDLVLYEADAPSGIETAFQEAVDDYVATCQQIGKQPQKPCSGTFQVRIPQPLHRQAVLRSLQEGVSMNEIATRSMDCFLNPTNIAVTDNPIVKIGEGLALGLIGAGSDQHWTSFGAEYVRSH